MSTTFYGLSHIDVPVTSLQRAEQIYHQATGFPVQRRGEGWLDIDAGGFLLRLVLTHRPEARATLRLQAPSVEDALVALVNAGTTLLYGAMRTPDQELIGAVRDPDGNQIYVWRPLTEDEFDYVPELPKEMTWLPEAEDFLKSLLRSIPALFRALARRRVVAVSEELAQGKNLVTREEVIRGFILASPRITRYRNRQPLIDHGVDVDRYREDWESD
ncbi:MAG: VOC family protein [Polyangiaceae bacterium]|jgi:predicted enzyme related to lactoylglutathione lyase|nr:VOC family protein [Polyangiaceae bacterium]